MVRLVVHVATLRNGTGQCHLLRQEDVKAVTYYQVISRFSLIVPRSLMSTATT